MKPVDRLRAASGTIRNFIDKLTTDTDRWDDAFPLFGIYANTSTYEHLIAHPGVGLAIADMLDTAAADEWALGPHCPVACIECDDDPRAEYIRKALVIADQVIGHRQT